MIFTIFEFPHLESSVFVGSSALGLLKIADSGYGVVEMTRGVHWHEATYLCSIFNIQYSESIPCR